MKDLPKKGELWREVDPRFQRTIEIKTDPVENRGEKRIGVVCRESGRETWPLLARFNGRRGGYARIEAEEKP